MRGVYVQYIGRAGAETIFMLEYNHPVVTQHSQPIKIGSTSSQKSRGNRFSGIHRIFEDFYSLKLYSFNIYKVDNKYI